MGKHLDALKSLDEFRAPWETEGGTDAEVDKPKLRRWIHGLLTDKAKAQDARDEADDKVKTVEAELETAKTEAATANGPDAQKKIDKLEKQLADVTADRDKIVADKEREDLRKEVLGDLDEKYAKYVVGETQDELEKSLKQIREDFDLPEPGEEGDDDDLEKQIRTQPRPRLKSGIDRDSSKHEPDFDPDKIADDILSRGYIITH